MDKKEMDKLRSSVLYNDEVLKVRCTNKRYSNFFNGEPMNAYPSMALRSGLPYPQPKWEACDYYVIDSDGDRFYVATVRYGEIKKHFEWVRE